MKVKNLNNHIQHIVIGYKQQYSRYQLLLEMAGKCRLLIKEGNVGQLEQVLRERQEVTKSIDEIEETINLHKEAVNTILHLKEFKLDGVIDLISINLRKEMDEYREQLIKVIQQILELDRDNDKSLSALLNEAGGELNKIKQHHEIQHAYLDRPERFPEPHLFDKKR